jgi:hypothetical protein
VAHIADQGVRDSAQQAAAGGRQAAGGAEGQPTRKPRGARQSTQPRPGRRGSVSERREHQASRRGSNRPHEAGRSAATSRQSGRDGEDSGDRRTRVSR